MEMGVAIARNSYRAASTRTTYIYGNKDIQCVILLITPRMRAIFLSTVVSHNQCILGQFLEKTFWSDALEVKVKSVNWGE
jgi:hypothetical protein